MTKNNINTILQENIENKDIIQKEMFSIDFLEKRLSIIPKKLYKFRQGNQNDLDALRNNYVWFSQPTKCDDELDSTLNFNVKKQTKNLEKYLLENIDFIALNLIKKQKPKIAQKINIEQIKYLRENYFTKDGIFLKGKAISFLGYKFSNKDVIILENSLTKIHDLLYSHENEISKLVENLISILNDTNNHIRNKMMIYCLCKEYKNLALWSKYANDNKGFCIEYRFDKASIYPKEITKNLFYLFPIYYGKKKNFNIFHFFEAALNNNFFKKEKANELSLEQTIEFNKQLLTKDSSWSWQKEWRVALDYNQNNRQPFPYISRIIIGSKASDELIKELEDICGNRIPLYKQFLNKSGSNYVYKKIKGQK